MTRELDYEAIYERIAAKALERARLRTEREKIESAKWQSKYVVRVPFKTHCKHGHARTPENVTESGGCIICKRRYQRDYWLRQKGRIHNEPDRGV